MFKQTARATRIVAPKSFLFKRTKATQPDLAYDFGALEPYISAEIMETHYTKHHRTYIAGFNTASEKLQEAIASNDIKAQNELLPLVNFNSGGYINHNLFWESLAPQKAGGGEPPSSSSALGKAIDKTYGSLDALIGDTNTKLAGIQGSGWAWLVKNKLTKGLDVITTANQDLVPAKYVPLLGIDAWEHAFYLQYKNVKADYFKAIWNVINWKEAEKRFDA